MPPFGFAFGAFLLFWFVNIFFVAADYIINAHAPFFLLLRFLIFRVPQSTPYAFPFACLFATLLGMGRLAGDGEVVALRTSGVSFARICATPLLLGLGIFALSFWVNDAVAPKAVALSTRTFYQIVYRTSTLPIVPQFFRKDDASGNVFYVGDVTADERTMHSVMIFQQATTTPFVSVTTAETAHVHDDALYLEHARITRFKRNGVVDASTSAQDVRIGLPIGENVDQFVNAAPSDAYALDVKALKTQISQMKATGQGGSALDVLQITLAQKYAFPFASFLAVLTALPLAVGFGRKGRTLGISLSILIFFVYYIMMSAFAALGKNHAINPYLSAWIPNVVMAGAGISLFRRVER